MKGIRNRYLLLGASALAFALLPSSIHFDSVAADGPVTEAKHATVYANDLTYVGGEGATWNSTTNEVRVSGAGRGFEYQHPSNALIKATYVHDTYSSSHWAGWLYILIRAQDDDASPTNAFVNRGYEIRWRGGGTTSFYKDGTLIDAVLAGAGSYSYGGTFKTEFSTIDLSDGSVQVTFKVNDVTVVDYNDATDPILSGNRYASYTDQHSYSVLGDGLQLATPYISKIGAPQTSVNFPLTSFEDGKAVTSASGAAGTGWSGVALDYLASGQTGYRVKATPKQLAGNIHFGIGWKNGPHDHNRPDITGEWGWSTVGYLLSWDRWGTLTLTKGDSSLATTSGPAFVVDEQHEFSIAQSDFEDGSTRITVRLDGALKINHWDTPSSENEPIPCPKAGLGTSQSELVQTAPIWSFWTQAEFDFSETEEPIAKSLVKTELGEPTYTGEQTIGANGDVSSLADGTILWPTKIQNAQVSFDLLPDENNGYLSLLLGYEGSTPLGPDDEGWTKKGYEVKIGQNGTISLAKAGSILVEGTPIIPFSLSVGTSYRIKASLVEDEDAGLIKVFIDDALVISYFDTTPLDSGEYKFGIVSNGYKGSALAADIDVPEIVCPETVVVGAAQTLSYEDPQSGDVVTYSIDLVKSTATGQIDGDSIVATSEGNLYVYCVVNGISGQSKKIVCENPSVTITGLPENYIIGSETAIKAVAGLSDERELSSITYEIAEGTESASIDSQGNVTVTGVGLIRVQATVEDINGFEFVSTAEIGSFVAKPVISLTDTSAMKVGQERDLSVEINAPIPEGDGFLLEVTGGADCLSLEGNKATALKEGSSTIQVTFAAGKPYETGETFVIDIVGSKIISLPSGPLFVGDNNGFVKAGLSNGDDGNVVTYYVENGTGKAEINEETGEIHYIAAGTVSVYAIVDGIATEKAALVINPRVTLGNALSMVVGGERNLGYHANCELPDEEVDLRYEVVSGADLVEIDTATGDIKALAIGIVSIRVHISGETFSATSPVVAMSIENPLVVLESPVRDMFVGQDQTILATLGNGEIKNQEKTLNVIEGMELVEVDGMTMHAIGAGKVRIYVSINGVAGLAHEFVVVPNKAMIVAGNMQLNDTQTLDCVFPGQDFTPDSIVYELVDTDPEVATLEGNLLTTGNKTGEIRIKVTVNGSLADTLLIHAESSVVILGVEEGADYQIGSSIELGYFDADDTGETPVYSVISGNAHIVLDGDKALLLIDGEGDVVIEVTVNGISSRRVTIKGVKPQEPEPEPSSSSSEEPVVSSSSVESSSTAEPSSTSSNSSAEPSASSSSAASSSSEGGQPQGETNVAVIVGITLASVVGVGALASGTVFTIKAIKARRPKE